MNPKLSKSQIPTHLPSPLEISPKIIKFYLRKPNKKTIIVHSQSPLYGKQIRQLINTKMNINMKDIVIYYEGKEILNDMDSNMKKYDIKNQDILHVHDIKNTEKKQLRIAFKPFQCNILIEELVCILAQPDQIIAQSLVKHIPLSHELAFIQSGRKIDIHKTYKQQHIQDDSVIIITTFTKKQQPVVPPSPLFSSVEDKKSERQKSKQYEDIHDMNSLPKQISLRRSVSLNPSQSCHLLSFKKKKKSNIYKSMKISDSKQIIWQSDGSGDISNKILKSKIPYKKQNKAPAMQFLHREDEREEHNNQQDQQRNEQLLLSSQQRIQLRNQFSRLFDNPTESRDRQRDREQVTQLQPPQMMNNFDFMEETEEVQMGDLINYQDQSDEDQDLEDEIQHQNSEQDDDQDDDQQYSRPMAQLSRSIGNSRGEYKAPMIPTKDTDKGNSMKN